MGCACLTWDAATPGIRRELLNRGAALIAAIVNIQKLMLWLELHGHTAQSLPALASLCASITSLLAIAVVLFAIIAALAARQLELGGTSD